MSLLTVLIVLLSCANGENPDLTRLDPSFGSDGMTVVDIGGPAHEDEPFTILQTPDGMFVTPGKAFNKSTGDFDFVLLGYKSSGHLEESFGRDGIVLTDFGGHDEGVDVVRQPDGKLVAGGFSRQQPTGEDFALARYDPNGSLDKSFGSDGRVTTDFFRGKDQLLALAGQPDGKVVAGGYATNGRSGLDLALVRYNSDGSVDRTFGRDGKVTTDVAGFDDFIFRLLIQPDGRIVAAGTGSKTKSPASADIVIARYNTNGTRDTAFGGDVARGLVVIDVAGGVDYGLAVAIQPDRKLLVGGLANNGTKRRNDFVLARYQPDGKADAGFGARGVVTTDFFGDFDQILALAIQPDDKILAVGHAKHPQRHFDFGFARYTSDGALDRSFAGDGKYSLDMYGGPDGLHGVVLQDDGKAVATGDAYVPSSKGDDFVLLRLLLADPDWAMGLVRGLPDEVFASRQARTELGEALRATGESLAAANGREALSKLRTVRERLDGCGTKADPDDWIVSCTAQARVRVLAQQMIDKLETPPTRREGADTNSTRKPDVTGPIGE